MLVSNPHSLFYFLDFTQKVYDVVAKIPKGKVMTYKGVAEAAGSSRAYRAVGNIMNKNPHAPDVPCHRVVKSDGSIGGFAHGSARKKKMLREEGVMFKNGKIDPSNFYNK